MAGSADGRQKTSAAGDYLKEKAGGRGYFVREMAGRVPMNGRRLTGVTGELRRKAGLTARTGAARRCNCSAAGAARACQSSRASEQQQRRADSGADGDAGLVVRVR